MIWIVFQKRTYAKFLIEAIPGVERGFFTFKSEESQIYSTTHESLQKTTSTSDDLVFFRIS